SLPDARVARHHTADLAILRSRTLAQLDILAIGRLWMSPEANSCDLDLGYVAELRRAHAEHRPWSDPDGARGSGFGTAFAPTSPEAGPHRRAPPPRGRSGATSTGWAPRP